MENHQKVTKYKLFGLTVLEVNEMYLNYDKINLSYAVRIPKDYYNAEFKDKNA